MKLTDLRLVAIWLPGLKLVVVVDWLETGGCVVDWLETGGCMVDWLETGGCLA